MALLIINGVDIPDPQKYSFPMQDVMGDSTYNENGATFRSRIRPSVCSIDLAWMATSAQAATILGAITDDMVSVTFFDPRINAYKEDINMFVGDRSCELVMLDGISSEANFWSISFRLTEY